MEEVCQTCKQARELKKAGAHAVSTDEKTGMQALERAHPDKPMKPGLNRKLEYEYIRNGTLCLIGNFDAATGRMVSPWIGPTRNEKDFANHIQRTVDTDPEATWIFIVDQLNTHKSESLVRLVADKCRIEQYLGVKGKSGVLESMASREEFLKDGSRRIRFIYTPKHTSWLNRIEMWFSILVRKLLKRAGFTSTEELRDRILAFIDYFNRTMAKPFKWTYAGRPLKA